MTPRGIWINPTGSVFCAHGAGFVVPWYEVEEYMHLDGAEIQDWDDGYDDSDDSSTGTAGAPAEDILGRGKIRTVPVMGQETTPVENILRCMEVTKKKKS